MTINVGLAQIPNSVDLSQNFAAIMSLLPQFKTAKADLILFPECSLSGFTAKIKESNLEVLAPYFNQIQDWTEQTGIEVVLPTAVAKDGHVYNSGRWFKPDETLEFFKIGLTDSEKMFFSVPEKKYPKVFESHGFRFAILICFEAQHDPWTYFKEGEADAILWPGYWGWILQDHWGPEQQTGKPNLIFSNLAQWKMPLLQANFSYNDLENHQSSGPQGLSFIIGADNILVERGPHKQVGGLIVTLEKNLQYGTQIKSCSLMT